MLKNIKAVDFEEALLRSRDSIVSAWSRCYRSSAVVDSALRTFDRRISNLLSTKTPSCQRVGVWSALKRVPISTTSSKPPSTNISSVSQ